MMEVQIKYEGYIKKQEQQYRKIQETGRQEAARRISDYDSDGGTEDRSAPETQQLQTAVGGAGVQDLRRVACGHQRAADLHREKDEKEKRR